MRNASGSDGSRFVVQKTSRTDDELRDRLGLHVLVQTEAGASVSGRFITERTRNYGFQGFRRTESAGELGVHLPF